MDSTQEDVFEEVSSLISSAVNGFNVCIMAYGQTGSGKTFTMVGDDGNPGLYFSAVDEIFRQVGMVRDACEFDIKVSVIEIYND